MSDSGHYYLGSEILTGRGATRSSCSGPSVSRDGPWGVWLQSTRTGHSLVVALNYHS
jgi:hypothetical protein